MLEIKNLSLGFKNKPLKYLFKNLNFKVKKGEIFVIFGKSGLGKSTLLNLIAGIEQINIFWSGKILFENEDVSFAPIEKRGIGFVMQDRYLFPHFTVRENLLFALPKKVLNKNQFINKFLDEVSMKELDKLYPYQLSGGQTSRIACLRALLSFPKAILLDEPFSSLDQNTKTKFRKFVFKEIKSRNIPCILVSHDRQDSEYNNESFLNL